MGSAELTSDPVAPQQSTPNDPAKGHQTIVVLDFGSQFSMLIARRVRELNTYCDLLPFDTAAERLSGMDVRGIILSGGPSSVYEDGAPMAPDWVFNSGLPVLGICYGMQLLAHQLGGKVIPGAEREYGPARIERSADVPLLEGLPPELDVWMSHGDRLGEVPPGFTSYARSGNSPYAVMADPHRRYYGIQFHPEVAHTPRGLGYPPQLCPRDLRSRWQLDARKSHRRIDREHPSPGRQWPRHLRAFRRR